MKSRKGWRIVWADGTAWDGDCPKWAAASLPPGARVIPIRIYGAGKWPCTACNLHMSH
jgi:hypothetical protein